MIGAAHRYVELITELLLERAKLGGNLSNDLEDAYAEQLDRCWLVMTKAERADAESITSTQRSSPHRMAELQAENVQLRKLAFDGPLTTPTGYSRRMLWLAWEAGRANVDHAEPERASLQIFNRWLLGPMGENHPIDDEHGQQRRDEAVLDDEHKDPFDARYSSQPQCPWILDDEDPDEGYSYCKYKADHVGVHETEFGKGRDQRWNLPPVDPRNEMLAMADSQFKKENSCACSPKYRELAPGVHAAYCPLAGRPL